MSDDRRLHSVKVGCCGFLRGMKNYFSQFKLVDVQQTFYKMPKLETALRWRQQVPSELEKYGWQVIRIIDRGGDWLPGITVT